MSERNSAAEIGEHGYAHWAKQPVTPGAHEVIFVPQSVVDAWEAYCSCGEWKGSISLYDLEPGAKEHPTAMLRAMFEGHKRRCEEVK